MTIDALEAIRSRRSIRRFRTDPIPLDVLEEVIECARWAPFGTAHDVRVIKVMAGETKAVVVAYLDDRLAEVIPVMAAGPARRTLTYARSLVRIIRDAPVLVGMFTAVGREGAERSIASAACAVQNLMLAAWARGLGACYLTGAIYLADEIAHLCDLAGHQLVGLIPLGYPAHEGVARREFPTVLWRGFGEADRGEPPAPPEAQISAVEQARAGAGERVLIVSDDLEVDEAIVAVLRRAGYEVTCADPVEALAVHRRIAPQVTIVDAVLRGVNGYDLAHAIDRATDGPSPVLIVTAAYDAADEEQALMAGASDVLSKPVRDHELLARVRSLADSVALYQRIEEHAEQLERANEELRRLQQMRDDLTNMIVHDMRTPLTNVLSGLQTIEATDYDSEITHEFLPEAINAGQDLADMINNLLDISKMEAGQLQLDREPVPAAEVMAEVSERVGNLVEEKRLRLETRIPEGTVLDADRDLLKRVLLNLLSNAIKFTPGGGEITVEARRDGNLMRMCVRDTGEGIPQDQLERLFAKFGQVERGPGKKRQGTGLGLAFVKLAVEAHGGEVSVESTVGEGSTFCFTIPPGTHA